MKKSQKKPQFFCPGNAVSPSFKDVYDRLFSWPDKQAKGPLSSGETLSLPPLSFKGIPPTDQSTDGKAHIGTAFKLLDIIVQST